ncbi:MSMEG_0570 family nitrogen starvation response protein [Pseudomonas sp. J452]|uniref:MSMEG_0570 family nitrogen starvation response protein n=1 Tax=Pseudomonas sp. J452 TaxID=2898441 RepID=UPI0021AD8304|nr:MSMEG_0570 family nitrogen starvation response protein [Pseudomonas sp. J452]UUY08637.1 MSMEG_0570 family nitrogen starvation response protein [Pseudomonas sp. J452]
MPAVNFKLRWPDGQEMSGYSPSTVIYEHLSAGSSYALEDFIARAECALNAASERVREVKGFYCSSAMDTLSALHYHARRYDGGSVRILDMQTAHAGQVNSGWSSF